jgi:hypothetical protein
MADPFPKLPLGTSVDGTETVVARQGGVLRRFTLSMLQPFFKGAKGDTGAVGPVGSTGLQGDRGPQGLVGPVGATGPIGMTGATGPQGPSPWIDMGTVTISETMALAVGASVRKVPVSCKGLVAGAPVTVFLAASMPTGFGISGAVCVANDTVEVSVTCPALALGAKYNVSARVLVARV